MSFHEVDNITERMMKLKSVTAVKIAHLILNMPGDSYLVTLPLLRHLLGCSTRALKTALDELQSANIVSVKRENGVLTMSLQRPHQSGTEIVLNTHNSVYGMHIMREDAPLPSPPENGGEVSGVVEEKVEKEVVPVEKRTIYAQNNAPPADMDEEEEEYSSSSSSLKSGIKSNIRYKKRKNDASDAAETNLSAVVESALEELGMNRPFIFTKVTEAARGMPVEMVKKTLEQCILCCAHSPSYLVKALTSARVKMLEDKRKTERRAAEDIYIGKRLKEGEGVKFSLLKLSPVFKDLADRLWDPEIQECRASAEHMPQVMEALAKAGGS